MSADPGKGHFIVVEGLEGAGKSTALRVIQRALRKNQLEVVTAREPGGTYVGERVRELIKETDSNEPLDPRAELLLFYAARVQLIEQVIRPTIARGACMLLDRFELSTYAYQGGGRKLDVDMIHRLSQFCLVDIKPDLILFLDVSPMQGMQRIVVRGVKDRIEQEEMTFFTDVYKAYHQRIQVIDNVVVIDASQPQRVVQAMIYKAVQTYLSAYVY